jgi:hypothetical protein
MAELTKPAYSDAPSNRKAGSKFCKSEGTPDSAGNSHDTLHPLKPVEKLVFVRYLDHVLYNRASALAMKPQTREAVGWLVYECEGYLILAWDRDAGPPTLKGGDAKASGLVLLRGDIVELKRLEDYLPLQNSSKWNLNRTSGSIKSRVCASSQGSEKLSSPFPGAE